MRSLAVLLAMLMGVGAVWAQSSATPATALLVLAKKDMVLAIVDPATMQVVAKVPVGVNPHEVIASEDGRTAWVTNYDNGSAHTITVVDLAAQRVTQTIDLGALWGPHGLFVSGGRTYFTAERAKVIGRLDATGAAVDWVLGTGMIGTHMIWVSRDGKKIVAVGVGSGEMDLMTERAGGPDEMSPTMISKQGGVSTRGKDGPPAPDWDETRVKVGTNPEGFDVIADAEGSPQTMWVANAGEGTISVIDFATKLVTATIPVGLATANRLRFTPDHRLALVSRQKSGDLAAVDVAQRKVVKQIAVGTGAAGVLIAPDGTRAYVSCSPDNWVAVVDLKTMTVVGKIAPGMEPDGLAWAVRH